MLLSWLHLALKFLEYEIFHCIGLNPCANWRNNLRAAAVPSSCHVLVQLVQSKESSQSPALQPRLWACGLQRAGIPCGKETFPYLPVHIYHFMIWNPPKIRGAWARKQRIPHYLCFSSMWICYHIQEQNELTMMKVRIQKMASECISAAVQPKFQGRPFSLVFWSLLVLLCFKYHFMPGCHLKTTEMNVGIKKNLSRFCVTTSDSYQSKLIQKLRWEMNVPYFRRVHGEGPIQMPLS